MSPFDLSLPVAIGCDHAGFEYKEDIISFLEGKGLPYKDFGTHSTDSVDYPDFAHPVALAVANNECAFGILLCGSGNGVAITANKHQGIRCALCWQVDVAQLARAHNDANMLAIPARFITLETTFLIIDAFLNTAFEGGRHATRVNKMGC